MQSLINYLLIYFITSIEDLYHYWWWHTRLAFLWSSSNSSQDSYKLIDQVQCTMSTFSTTFFVIIICIKVQLCTPEYRVLQVEQIFNDRVVVDNILADYDHSSSSLCTVLCQQENCECFDLTRSLKHVEFMLFVDQITQLLTNQVGSITEQVSFANYHIYVCLLFPLRWLFSYKCFPQILLFLSIDYIGFFFFKYDIKKW